MTKDEWALKASREAQAILLAMRDFVVGRIRATLCDEERDLTHLAVAVAVDALHRVLMDSYTETGKKIIGEASEKLAPRESSVPVAKA